MTMNRYMTRVQKLEREGRKAEARAEAMAKRPDLPSRAFIVMMPEDRGF